MNPAETCPHNQTGWCHACVRQIVDERDRWKECARQLAGQSLDQMIRECERQIATSKKLLSCLP